MFEDRDWLMTQQAEADDRGDDAAGDVATHGTHTCRQDPPGGEEADQGCAIGMDQLLALWPWRHPKDAAPTEMRTDLARLSLRSRHSLSRSAKAGTGRGSRHGETPP